jgi:hypothetical protein
MRILGLASLLSQVYYDQAGGSLAFSKNQDPSATMRDIADRFALKFPGLISYDAQSIENTGTTANLSFSSSKASDAVKAAAENNDGWWWSVGPTGTLHFHPKTGAATQTLHKLDMGSDIESMTVEENLERLVNSYILDYTGGTVTAQNAASIASYGIRELRESKTEITNSATANAAAAAYISKNSTPKRRIEMRVSSRYDIESIRPGDLVTVRNFDYPISALQIAKTEYNPDGIKLELEDILSFAKEVLTP